MPVVSRTTNPLPFEHLEPRRFEDLVRQLVYDLKDWQNLEATGRSGADEGFDARGYEFVPRLELPAEDEERTEEQESAPRPTRLWQIQCKREKTITPSKIRTYAKDMIGETPPYGVIFAAPTDLSKKARDAFVAVIREAGVEEYHLFGRAELEDLLFQPKNDHLLFAYFGFSLQLRKRAQKSELRSVLVTKRKLIKIFGELRTDHYTPVLIRDIQDKAYPYKGEVPNFDQRPKWKAYYFVGYRHDGIRILLRRFYAYVDREKKEWDFTEAVDLSRPHEDEWNAAPDRQDRFDVYDYFQKHVPKEQRYYFEVVRLVPYTHIIEVDAQGDPYTQLPHLYTEWHETQGPFVGGAWEVLASENSLWRDKLEPSELKRVKFLPDVFPKAERPKAGFRED